MRINFDENFNYKLKIALKKTFTYALFISGLAYASCKASENIPENSNETFIDVSGNLESNIATAIEEIKDNNEISMNIVEEEPIEENIVESKPAIEDTRKVVTLTFDDGPGKYTDRLLDILKENDAKATFFVLGKNIKYYEEAVQRAYNEGHEIGMHGYSHKTFIELGKEGARKELVETYNILREIYVEPSHLIRTPTGSCTDDLVQNLNYAFIYWTIDTRDWQSRDKEKIKQIIRNEINEGYIIILHDIHECSVDAMEELLPELTDEYRFVTVSEMFDILDNDLDTCNVYKKAKVKD